MSSPATPITTIDDDITPVMEVQSSRPLEEVSTIELEIHKLVNIERRKIGRVELQYDDALAHIAEKHSIDMYVRDFFAHKNHSGDNSFKRAAKAGYKYRAYGENIAWYSSTRLNKMTKQEIANKIMYGEKGWWLSKKGHKENLLSANYDREGLGVWIYSNKVWATQNLAKRKT